MTTTTTEHTVLGADEGRRLQSGPGRDLVFKVTGEDTGGAFDYFTVEVAPEGGPPLHVHHKQEETIHVLNGRFQVRIGDELFELHEGGFANLCRGDLRQARHVTAGAATERRLISGAQRHKPGRRRRGALGPSPRSLLVVSGARRLATSSNARSGLIARRRSAHSIRTAPGSLPSGPSLACGRRPGFRTSSPVRFQVGPGSRPPTCSGRMMSR